MNEEFYLHQSLKFQIACVKVLNGDFVPTVLEIQYDFQRANIEVDSETINRYLNRVLDFIRTKLSECVFVNENNREWIDFLKKYNYINLVVMPLEPTDDTILLFVKWKLNSLCENVLEFFGGSVISVFRDHEMIKQTVFGDEKEILESYVNRSENRWWNRNDFTINEFSNREDEVNNHEKIILITFNEKDSEKR